jgi:hypothetical protein
MTEKRKYKVGVWEITVQKEEADEWFFTNTTSAIPKTYYLFFYPFKSIDWLDKDNYSYKEVKDGIYYGYGALGFIGFGFVSI